MNNIKNLSNEEGIKKLQELVEDINTCLFCTKIEDNNSLNCRPMSALKVCDQGNIWFFSEKNSDKNKDIATSSLVKLYFSSPSKSSFLVVDGNAEILFDKQKIEELWNPMAKVWFKEGKDDPDISIIKVKPSNCYYWDTEGNRMINFFKSIASLATGTTLVSSEEGRLSVD